MPPCRRFFFHYARYMICRATYSTAFLLLLIHTIRHCHATLFTRHDTLLPPRYFFILDYATPLRHADAIVTLPLGHMRR